LTEQFVYRPPGGKIEGGNGFFARSARGFYCAKRWMGFGFVFDVGVLLLPRRGGGCCACGLGFFVVARVARFAFVARAVWLLWPLRWHPRYGVCSSCFAPVRGGTYFSLPPQRKVGKRKRLTPPTFLLA
jgi:hypothetical protein